jgi:hypothetical protein
VGPFQDGGPCGCRIFRIVPAGPDYRQLSSAVVSLTCMVGDSDPLSSQPLSRLYKFSQSLKYRNYSFPTNGQNLASNNITLAFHLILSTDAVIWIRMLDTHTTKAEAAGICFLRAVATC